MPISCRGRTADALSIRSIGRWRSAHEDTHPRAVAQHGHQNARVDFGLRHRDVAGARPVIELIQILLLEDVVAEVDTLIADEDRWASDEFSDLEIGLTTERAEPVLRGALDRWGSHHRLSSAVRCSRSR